MQKSRRLPDSIIPNGSDENDKIRGGNRVTINVDSAIDTELAEGKWVIKQRERESGTNR